MGQLSDNALLEQAQLLIGWLQVLNNGRVRPDDPTISARKFNNSDNITSDKQPCCNETGVVRDSHEFRETITQINRRLGDILL